MANKKAASSAAKAPVDTRSSQKTTVTTVTAVSSHAHSSKNSTVKRSFFYRLTSTVVLAESLAEFIGTFLLTAIVLTQQNQPIALLFAVVGLVLILGGMSGAHLNPAATIGAWVTRKIDSPRAVAYVVAQVLGAMLALVVLNAFISQAATPAGDMASLNQSSPSLYKAVAVPAGKEWTLLFAELIGTTILGIAYANSHRFKHDKITAAFTTGAGYFVALVVAGTVATYVQASVILNPAVSVSASALSTSTPWPVSIYIVTSVIGGVLGFAIYDLIKKAEKSTD